MEEAYITNIVEMLAKEICIESNKQASDNHINNDAIPKSYPLLESDDEAFTFFLQQHANVQLKKCQSKRLSQKRKIATQREQHKRRLHFKDLKEIRNSSKDTLLRLNLLNLYDTSEFQNLLHMSKTTFLKIFKSLKAVSFEAIRDVPPQAAFSLALWKLTTDEHFEEIARRFQIPLHNCISAIRQFWHIVSGSYEMFIKWPNTYAAQKAALNDFKAIHELKSFDNLFGIIASKHLDIFLESDDDEIAIVLQIVCDAQEKIIDCFVDYANNYSFDSSPIGRTLELNKQTIPKGSYIIGDSSFPLRPFLMRPFGNKYRLLRKAIDFDRMLLPALEKGERVLELMAHRFQTLYALEAKDISEVRQVLETICSLHNLCIDHKDKCINDRNVIAQCKDKLDAASNGCDTNEKGELARFDLMERIVK